MVWNAYRPSVVINTHGFAQGPAAVSSVHARRRVRSGGNLLSGNVAVTALLPHWDSAPCHHIPCRALHLLAVCAVHPSGMLGRESALGSCMLMTQRFLSSESAGKHGSRVRCSRRGQLQRGTEPCYKATKHQTAQLLAMWCTDMRTLLSLA